MARKSKVYFFFEKPVPTLRHRTELKDFIIGLFRREQKGLGSLSVVFCSDQDLLRINREYLGHDYYTDIITFDLSDHPGAIEAEIHISIDRVRDNSRSLGEPFTKELHRVLFHGVLHLCGYSDKNTHQRREMRQKEDESLKRYFG